jgi:class 3 adenylate cyclase
VLERLRWDDQAVTAAEVTALQEFRDLFGSEVLAPGQEIGIESVTIVFSDLKDSTRLYEEAGDAPAYGQVGRHFEFLKKRIARHHGAVVKTIGDAVMAIFHQPADAVRCCLAIQRDLPSFNAAWPSRPLVVKLGLHSGPAIAINANGLLDYFGRTVNVAARLLRESQGGDVVLAKRFAEDVRVREALTQERPVVVDEWTTTLRGMSEPLTLRRIAPS